MSQTPKRTSAGTDCHALGAAGLGGGS